MLEFLHTPVGPLALNDWISWFFILGGAFFSIVGALGIVRLPDVFSRMHGAGMVDTAGIDMILIGLMFQATEWIVVVKLGLILLFLFFTSPTTTFALARAAISGGVNPGPKRREPHQLKDQKAQEETTSSNT
ncbi:monovalent cation/H(+) antiporter subunit G [Magnetovibrio sp. PR-2]|uniref:monovalent cation/H(+) antiporter subunit G n=1 Tax=Magnetovibrio sp. PR-2 TaxID=3120356 RepID=UPI002FCE30E6